MNILEAYLCPSRRSWRIYPGKMVFYPTVSVGAHNYYMQWYTATTTANQCLAGYPTYANNFFMVEEYEPTVNN